MVDEGVSDFSRVSNKKETLLSVTQKCDRTTHNSNTAKYIFLAFENTSKRYASLI